jgi:hypothetical protein
MNFWKKQIKENVEERKKARKAERNNVILRNLYNPQPTISSCFLACYHGLGNLAS